MNSTNNVLCIFLATEPTQEQRVRAPAPERSAGSLTNWLGATTAAPQGCAASIGKDILFLIDGTVNFQQSYDESQKDFRRIKKFIKTVVRDLSDERFNVGVMQYANKGAAKMEIDFMSVKDLKEFKVRVGTIIQDGGYKRYTGDALVKANNKVCIYDCIYDLRLNEMRKFGHKTVHVAKYSSFHSLNNVVLYLNYIP